jgi:hypothetical protein
VGPREEERAGRLSGVEAREGVRSAAPGMGMGREARSADEAVREGAGEGDGEAGGDDIVHRLPER